MCKTLMSMLAVALLVGADQPRVDDTTVRTGNLLGVWKAETMEIAGKKGPDDVKKRQMRLTFDIGNLSVQDVEGEKTAAYKIDVAKKPAQIDIMPTEGPEKGKVLKMIFQVDGNVLRIGGGGGPISERPKNFDDKDIMVMTFKREKK